MSANKEQIDYPMGRKGKKWLKRNYNKYFRKLGKRLLEDTPIRFFKGWVS